MSIEFEKLVHIYSEGTPFSYLALNGITLSIREQAVTAIIGHTGSGKSTLVQHLNGLLLPTSGKLTVGQYVISATDKPAILKPLRKQAGLVFQFPEYQLFEETIEKDIIFGPINFGVDSEEAKKKAVMALRQVGLDESYMQKSPFDLSGGQKRRVAIAGILVMEPEILVLDEPTAGLDPQGAKEMMMLFRKLNEKGTTIIIVTHDMNQVLEYCDDAVVMNGGKIVRSGSVEEIFSHPDELADLSIELPLVTQMILDLNSKGFTIPTSLKTVEELADYLGGVLQ